MTIHRVRKAVFPVAGLGTRFLPATKSMPKEMLTVVDKPLIQYAVEEALEAGIEQIIFVTGRGKGALEDHFDISYELEDTMRARGKGGIVIVSSVAGHQPTPFFTVYGATKAYDLMLGEALWDELRGTGVDVVALCPGSTITEFADQAHMAHPGEGMAAGPVVTASLRRLGRGPSVVTGLGNFISASLSRFLPRSWVAASTGAVLAQKLLGKSKRDARHS